MKNTLLRRRMLTLAAAGTLIFIGWLARWFALPTEASADATYSVAMIAAAIIAGISIARRAVQDVLAKRLGIETLVTIAVTGAVIIGEFWEAAAVTFLFVLGAALEAATVNRTRDAVGKLLDLTPNTAIVVRGGQQIEVDAYEVEFGEEVLVKAGGRVPVDGEVLSGYAAVDESSITGESAPAEKLAGHRVFAGTTLVSAPAAAPNSGKVASTLLRIRATGIGEDTTLARIINRVEEAQESKAPAQRTMEKFASRYTPAVVLLALITFAFTRDIEIALTLLVIACPGALVISMPVTFVAGIGRAAQRGILIKGGQYLERAAKIEAVAFDKTGTLTRGRPELTHHISIHDDYASADVLRWAAIAETGSEHPLAAPIIDAARAKNILLPAHADSVETHPGLGIIAHWDGRVIRVGNPKFLIDLASNLPAGKKHQLEKTIAEHTESGRTTVLVALDDKVLGALAIADSPRVSSAQTIADLKHLGVTKTIMLTGDDHRVARAVAARLGISDVRAGLLPEDKLAAINGLRSGGTTTAMIGDGVNDAPALAAADVGVAMGAGGTAVAVETADVALMTDDLGRISELIYLARRTRRVLVQNVVIALATVALLIFGVLFAGTTMAIGMLVHELSVLVVVANAVRLLRAPAMSSRRRAQNSLGWKHEPGTRAHPERPSVPNVGAVEGSR